MTAPNKDILNLFHANAKGHIGRAQEAKEWFELYRDGKELPEKGQAFLQDCVRELNGIPHEADNHTNGGAAVPSGEASYMWYASCDEENYTVGPCDSREQVISEAKANELDVDFDNLDDESPRKSFFIIRAKKENVDVKSIIQLEDIIESWDNGEGYDLSGDSDEVLSEQVNEEQWSALQSNINNAVDAWVAENNIEITPFIFTHITDLEEIKPELQAGWRDDVPDESKPDQENVAVRQGYDHGGIVVEGDVWQGYEGGCTVERVEDGVVYFQGYEPEENEEYTELVAIIVEHHALIKPSPLREQDKQDAGDTVDSSSSNTADQVDDRGVRQDVGSTELKDVADEQKTIVEGSQEKPAEEDQTEAAEDRSTEETDDTVSDSASADGCDGDGNGDDGNGQADEINHPLASWITEQEWRQPCPFGSSQPLTIHVDETEFFEDGTMSYQFSDLQTDTCRVEDFITRFTPKGWERFDSERSVTGGKYDVVTPFGQTVMDQKEVCKSAMSSNTPIFIREHQPESKEDEQDNARMGPDNFQSREFVGEGEAVDVVNSEKVKIFDTIVNKVYEVDVKDEQEAELEAGEDVQAIETETQGATSVGLPYEPEDNSLADVIKAHATDLTPEQLSDTELETTVTETYKDLAENSEPLGEEFAKAWDDNADKLYEGGEDGSEAVDLIEGRVGDELDKLEGVE